MRPRFDRNFLTGAEKVEAQQSTKVTGVGATRLGVRQRGELETTKSEGSSSWWEGIGCGCDDTGNNFSVSVLLPLSMLLPLSTLLPP